MDLVNRADVILHHLYLFCQYTIMEFSLCLERDLGQKVQEALEGDKGWQGSGRRLSK